MVLKGVLLLLLLAAASAKNSFIVNGPKYITLGQDYTVNVNILQATRPVTVVISILQKQYIRYRYTKVPIVSVSKVFEQGNPQSVTLKVPMVTSVGSYALKVIGSGGAIFEREESLSRNYKYISGFVQTDKAVYKPGQTVRFRTLVFDRSLKMYDGPVTAIIYDPHHNRMEEWRSISDESGVNERDFQLGEQTPIGQWKIQLSIPEFTSFRKYVYFDVQQYDPPKVEVLVELPSFGVISDQSLNGKITAKYTFGKAVKGKVELRVYVGQLYGYCGAPARYVHKAYDIDGSVDFSVSVADMKRIRYSLNHQTITVVAEVKDELTGKSYNGTSKVTYYPERYKISFMESSFNTFKPKLSYIAYVKVSEQDDRPVTNARVKVFTCVRYEIKSKDQHCYECSTFSGTYGLPQQDLLTGPDGVAEFNLDIPENVTEVKMRALYGTLRASRTVYQSQSPSGTFILISVSKMDLKPGDMVPVEIKGTSNLTEVTYQISARGVVIKCDVAKNSDPSNPNVVKFDMKVLNAMSPTCTILAYYVRSDGEIVADSINLNVDDPFENKVSIEFDVEEAEPRDDVTVNVKADVNSTAFVAAIDQSVLLMKEGNDITGKKVMEDIRRYAPSSPSWDYAYWRYPRPVSGQNAQQIIWNAQTVVITDCVLWNGVYRPHYNYGGYSRYPTYPSHYGPSPMYRASPPMMMSAVGTPLYVPYPGGPSLEDIPLKEVEFVRYHFPETWLWQRKLISSESGEKISVTVPDTITSWIASVFAVNPKSGLGVAAATAKLRTFRPFFVTLKLPLSIVKGEVLVVQANVHNYLGTDIKAKVQLTPNDDFSSNGALQYITVQRNKIKPVFFTVALETVGKVDIEVRAQSNVSADAVRRQLTVKPEGIRQEMNTPTLIHLTPQEGRFRKSFTLRIPQGVVADSLKISLTMTGDLLGPTIDNLQDLISLPTGCAEQTLVKFAPNIYILDYLTMTNQITQQLEDKILTYLRFGYQRLLSYQRRDRSFSAFGERDPAGSVWLTALFQKVFHQVSGYIDVDPAIIDYAVNFILSKQADDGGFVEPGPVIDRHLQGRDGQGPALTSHVVECLLETANRNGSRVNTNRFQTAITKAVTYLESQSFDKMDLHELSITAYALTKAKSEVSDKAMSVLLSKATVTSDQLYWKVNSDTPRVQSIDILTTCYSLAGLVHMGNLTEGMKIVRWLVKQKSGHGGFRSSSDTMLAIKVLTSFLAKAQPENYNMNIKVTVDQVYEKIINKENALVVNSFEVDSSANRRRITIEATGRGMALVEVTVKYNIKTTNENVFDINAITTEETFNDFTVMVCARHLDGGSSGMTVASIQIPTGFGVDLSNAGKIAGVKRVEQKEGNVVVYYYQIGVSATCVPLSCTRQSLVVNNMRAYIFIVDYYDPGETAGTVSSYLPQKIESAKICDVCEKCNGCNNQ